MRPVFLLSIFAGALLAQIGFPGQYPGQYPGGGYPGGGGGVPIPGRRSKTNTPQQKPNQTVSSRTYSGVIRKIDPAGTFDLELEDTRFLLVQTSSSTSKPADLKVGDGVDVVATENREEPFQATSITPNPKIAAIINENDQLPPDAATAQEQDAPRTGPPPTILVRPDQTDDADADAPKLKRGKPVQRASNDQEDSITNAPQQTVARVAPVSQTDSKQAFIEKARGVAASFLEGLPNYVCQEVATRYASETRVPSWNVIDVVTTDLVFEEGKESYRNITINGKPSRKPPEESGAWSSGEFGTILAALFNPGTRASFKYVEDGSSSHMPASIYDFAVERLRSAWTVHTSSQYINSAYKGSVWIDKQSAHTLRIEMQAKDVPQEFPLVSIETAVDYDYVTLGTPEKFLLPVHAEILSCERGSNECERNVIEFRNYHKFTGESTIKFGADQN